MWQAAGGGRDEKGSKDSKREMVVKTATRLYAAVAVLFFTGLRKLAMVTASLLLLLCYSPAYS